MNNLVRSLLKSISSWFFHPDRVSLLRWSVNLFSIGAFLTCIIGLRYFTAYHFPSEPLAIFYTVAAYISHFGSIFIIVWTLCVLWILLLVPVKKIIIPWSIVIVAAILTLTLLDSQLFATNRFHFSFLTIKIFGIKTWGFGLLYMCISIVFVSFCAKSAWDWSVHKKKSSYIKFSLPLVLLLLLFTHLAHIWADAIGYIPITRFTATLPLFYPSVDSKRMQKYGFSKTSSPLRFDNNDIHSEIHYPLTPLTFSDSLRPNILFIGIDDMRSELLNDSCTPNCLSFARNKGIIGANHWSGGNSTKMGLFSLFYGISPTYQQAFESNKISSLFIDRLLALQYKTGIFTSYRCDAPANLDVTAFVKIKNLRIKTVLPGKQDPVKKDSAITDEFISWLGTKPENTPFFGFLFYDALCTRTFPATYDSMVTYPSHATDIEKEYLRYTISMRYIDSLISKVIGYLSENNYLSSTIIILTSDHGEEFDDNHLGIKGHGSSFSDCQVRSPLIVYWPGMQPQVISKRTSHNDITATLMKHALKCQNPLSDYSCGNDLFSEDQWNWLIAGSYFNFAIIEPEQVIIQFPGGYFQVRNHQYQTIAHPVFSRHLQTAHYEMGRFFRK